MVVDGVELLRKITNNEFKSGQKIRDEKFRTEFIYTIDGDRDEFNFFEINEEGKIAHSIEAYYTIPELAITKFEIISEEDKEIDIQAIEELDKEVAYTNIDYVTGWDKKEQIIIEKQNEIIKAIKQLDKKLKE